MLTPLDEYVQQLPRQAKPPEIYVDDGTITIVGRAGTVATIATEAALGLVRAFEHGAGLPVSRTKAQVTGSTMGLARNIAGRLRHLGCKAVRAMKVLGIDTAAGRGGIRSSQRQRMTAMDKRAARFKRLLKWGASIVNVVKTGVAAGASYGTPVIGLIPSVVARLKRTFAMALPHKAKSASLTLRYLTSRSFKLEPSFVACEAPLMFWCKVAFNANGSFDVIW